MKNQRLINGQFEKGNNLAKGGKRPGAGRPTRAEVAALEKAKERIQKIVASNSDILAARYIRFTGVDAPTCRHAVDKLWPTERQEGPPPVPIEINVNFQLKSQISEKDVTPKEQIDDGRITINVDPTLRPDAPVIDVTSEQEAEKK